MRHEAERLAAHREGAAAVALIAGVLAAYEAAPPDPLEHANAIRVAALAAEAADDRPAALLYWRDGRDRYAALTGVIERMSGQPGNPAVAESERRITQLGG